MGAVVLVCGSCKADLPEGSQYCLKCGEPLSPSAAVPPVERNGECDCGSLLPAGAQFCPYCKQVVVGAFSPWHFPLRRRVKRSYSKLVWAPVLIAIALWALVSDSPAAQGVQRTLNLRRAETIAPGLFSVASNSFSSYKFTVPARAKAVIASGHFVAGETPGDDVEVYLLTEADVINWQYGYAPNSFYSSGRVHEGTFQVELPERPGTYCLVFNNNFAANANKKIQDAVTVSYRTWLPSL